MNRWKLNPDRLAIYIEVIVKATLKILLWVVIGVISCGVAFVIITAAYLTVKYALHLLGI